MRELNLLPRELHTPCSRIDRALDWTLGSHVVGIDVTADALRAAHVRRHRGHVSIVQIRQIPLPSASSLAAAVHSNAAITAAFATLRDLLVSGGMPKRAVVVLGVRDPELVAVRRSGTPWSTGTAHARAESILRQQAQSLVPRQTAAAAIGWEPVVGHVGGDAVDVCTAAVDLRLLDPLVTACRTAGWRVGAVEPTAWALRRLLSCVRSPPPEATDDRPLLVWIDVGGSSSTLTIFRNDVLQYAQDVAAGVSELRAAFHAHVGIPATNPDVRERHAAFFEGRGSSLHWEWPSELNVVLALLAERLRDAFTASTYLRGAIRMLRITGVGGRIRALCSAISDAFRLSTFSPTLGPLPTGGDAMGNGWLPFATAIGHAMRGTLGGMTAIRWEDAASVAATTRLVAAPPERPAVPPYRPSDLELGRLLHAFALRVHDGMIDVRSGRGFVDAFTAIAADRVAGSEAFGRALSAVASALHGKESQWTRVLAGHLVLPPEVALALEHLRAAPSAAYAERFLAGCARHIESGRTDRSTAQLVASFLSGP